MLISLSPRSCDGRAQMALRASPWAPRARLRLRAFAQLQVREWENNDRTFFSNQKFARKESLHFQFPNRILSKQVKFLIFWDADWWIKLAIWRLFRLKLKLKR